MVQACGALATPKPTASERADRFCPSCGESPNGGLDSGLDLYTYTNELVDNVLVSRDGFCDAATVVYADGHDLKDPLISPVYGDMQGFPPAILTTGTRDLLLSNTVRVHRALRAAGVEAELEVYEGQSHAQYLFDDSLPETAVAFGEIAEFFDKHLGK